MTDVTKGFRDGRFASVAERDRRDLLKLMARGRNRRIGAWRYAPALDLSPWIDSPQMTTSLERLEAECGEGLRSAAVESACPHNAPEAQEPDGP